MVGCYLSNGATVPTLLTELPVVSGGPFKETAGSRTQQENARSQSSSNSSLGSSTRDHPVSTRAWCAAKSSLRIIMEPNCAPTHAVGCDGFSMSGGIKMLIRKKSAITSGGGKPPI